MVFLILSYHQDDDNATKIIAQEKSAIGYFCCNFKKKSLAMDKEKFESFFDVVHVYLSIYLSIF